MAIEILVGTVKGGFRLSERPGGAWTVEGPFFKGWRVTAFGETGSGWLAATASPVYGAAVHRSDDLRTFRPVDRGPAWSGESGHELRQVWTFARAGEVQFAGAEEAGLFRSDDGGATWSLVPGLTDHSSREAWFPGFGGLCAHAVLATPDARRLWVGISAVGVFRSDDGGATWNPKNEGVPRIVQDPAREDVGYCVHGLVADPADPDRLFRQDHAGVVRSTDGGDRWERIEDGLPSTFGFPIARSGGALYCVPLESDEARVPPGGTLRVLKSEDDGARWRPAGEGLPTENAWTGVLRAALATDERAPDVVALGTTSGSIHVSTDAAESFATVPGLFPRVLCVRIAVRD
ncbi:MAG: exo-alpha-sialidase [Planctomycetota bacterium JB042]